jgi:mitochondrial chaperone BCS1
MGKWRAVRFRSASTFATVAMDAALRQAVWWTNRTGSAGRSTTRAGRAWKAGYLIDGPPGTGKSSLVAAISNHLRFDVYDLDIGSVRSNTELRKLLIRMRNRSILLVEDVDCALETAPRTGDAGGSEESSLASKNREVSHSVHTRILKIHSTKQGAVHSQYIWKVTTIPRFFFHLFFSLQKVGAFNKELW